MIVMDRENALAPGWSHVHSTADTLEGQRNELERFRRRIGAHKSALQLGRRWLHLDVKRGPREKALADPGVRVFESSRALVGFLRAHVLPNRAKGA